MANNPCLATIRGLPHLPNTTEINVRTGPGTNHDIAFKGKVGTPNLAILEITADSQGKQLDGKVYQWFKLDFTNGVTGWIRDDLLAIQGDCGDWGYSILPPDTFAFALTRNMDAVPTPVVSTPIETPPPAATTPTATQPTSPAPTVTTTAPAAPDNDITRTKKAALAITMAFEGSGYAAYNNYDKGIISYGIIQFAMTGSLITLVDNYISQSSNPLASELTAYRDRIAGQDQTLRDDENLRRILVSAAEDPIMQQVQNDLAISNYWDRTINNFVVTRNYKFPLTYALLFDVSVNFGVGDGFIRMAERDFGIPQRSTPEASGVSEQRIVGRIVELRKISHDKQAARDNAPGLSVRGDFWVNLVRRQDWNLMGDSEGFVYPFDKKVQVAQPQIIL